MITAALIAFPFLAALLLLVLPPTRSKQFALAATLIQAAITVYVVMMFNINERQSLMANMQFILRKDWIESFGISFFVGLDGISVLMIILTNFLLPFIVLTTWNRPIANARLFYFLMLFMQGALVGVFVSLDAFLYYIFWELALIPIYFIVLLWGGENRVKITFKFFIYTLAGSLFMLAGIIWLYLQTNDRSFGIDAFYSVMLDPTSQRWIFWAFFIAYAIKIPYLAT
jgi:NADH-quinone oxidoreductase subunit M